MFERTSEAASAPYLSGRPLFTPVAPEESINVPKASAINGTQLEVLAGRTPPSRNTSFFRFFSCSSNQEVILNYSSITDYTERNQTLRVNIQDHRYQGLTALADLEQNLSAAYETSLNETSSRDLDRDSSIFLLERKLADLQRHPYYKKSLEIFQKISRKEKKES